MKKIHCFLGLSLFLFAYSLQPKCQNVDTINVLAQNKVHMGSNGSYYNWAVFPPDTNSYRKVLLNFTLGCPTGGCSQWDYTVDIYLNHNTGIKDSTTKQAPSFTVNGNIMDSIHISKDTTYTTSYNSTTHLTDSTKNTAYTIIQYKDTLTPTVPTDTIRWWSAGYYKYYYNASGVKTDSAYVAVDTTMYVKYKSYIYKYDSIESYEIARMITPYAGYYPNTWTYPYVFDVTDFDWMMHDSVQIQVFYSGWTDGFTATCNFQMITGIPPRNAYKTKLMWTGSFPYGSSGNPISNYLVPVPVKIDSAASAVRLRVLQTGHGEDNNNCTEFCANYQHIKINSVEHFTPYVWRDLCGLNPLYHQAGTWLYDRANWCPGELITPYEDDLTPYVTPNTVDTILMSMDPYTSPNGGSIYTIGSELIYYGPINFSLDASLDDILAPTTNPLYSRFNPACNPQVVIRNTGSTPITSLDIIYGSLGGATGTYHWTGNLLFNDTNLVTLPAVSLGGASHLFRAKVSNPNGAQDMYANNDSLVTPFTTLPNYSSSFVIRLLTNSAASEDSYFIADDQGNIVHQKSGFANNTTYRDTVSLQAGCYHFEIDDAGKDGLSFFANSDGNGSLQFYRLSPATAFLTFQPDFGTSAIQNFTVGGPLDIDEITPTDIDYKVYPNPANSEVIISQLTNSNKDKEIRLYSEMGALVYEKLVKASNDTYNINTSGLAQGLYCLVMSNDDGVVVKKITVIH